MCFSEDSFEEFIRAIARLNDLPLDVAGDYAAQIGDTPALDEDGLAVITDDAGQVIARVRIPVAD